MRESPGIATVAGLPRPGNLPLNWACWSTLVMPSPASVMAMPTTIWSRPMLTLSTAMTTAPASPPTTPAPNPSHSECSS